MRHRKHNHQLGVKSAHRSSLLANLSSSLIENGRIKTTLAKAKALRPTVEKVITLAKKAHATTDIAQKVHYRRLAIARIRDKKAVKKLFDELVEQFTGRNGGYTRIYKLALPRLGDAADMALIEFVEDITPKKKSKKKKAVSDQNKVKESIDASETKDPIGLAAEESVKPLESEKQVGDEQPQSVSSDPDEKAESTNAEQQFQEDSKKPTPEEKEKDEKTD